jgi:hypothetical protein
MYVFIDVSYVFVQRFTQKGKIKNKKEMALALKYRSVFLRSFADSQLPRADQQLINTDLDHDLLDEKCHKRNLSTHQLP